MRKISTSGVRSALLAAAVGLLTLLCSTGNAATVIWTNTAGGSWKTAKNWSPNKVPGDMDDAVINLDGAYTVTVNASANAGNLILGGGAGAPKLSITAGTFKLGTNGVATRNAVGTILSGALLELAGGILDSEGMWNVAGTMNWTKGEIRPFVSVAPGGRLNMSSANLKQLSSGILDNAGVAVWSDNGAFQLGLGTSITNRGVFEVQNDLTFGTTNKAVFVNQGTLRKVASSGLTTFGAVELRNKGCIDLQTGGLELASGKHSFSDGSRVTGPGSVSVPAAELTLSGAISTEAPLELTGGTLKGTFQITGDLNHRGGSINNNAILNGTLNVLGGDVANSMTVNGAVNLSSGQVSDGLFTLNGDLNWTGGTMASTKAIFNGDIDWSGGVLTGNLLVQQGRTLVVSDGALKQINGGALTNRGAVRLEASSGIKCDNAATIYNYASFLLANDTPFTAGATTPSRFFNYGSLLKTGTGQLTWSAIELHNRATVEVQAGILALGTRAHSLEDNSAITGAGRFQWLNGSLALGTNVTVPGALEIIDGALTASGAFNGNIEWTKGSLAGVLTVPAGRQIRFTGTGTKTFTKDSVLNVAGTALADGNDSLVFFANATINNTGTFEFQNDGNFSFNATDKAWFNNAGTLRKTVSSVVLPFGALQLVNTGTVEIQTGEIQFTANTHTLGDGSRILGTGALRVNGGTLSLNGAVTSSAPLYLALGSLGGNGSFAGAVNVSGGQVLGNVRVDGPVTWSAGSLAGTLTASQTMEWTGGTISGTLLIPASASLTVQSGGIRTLTGVINNAGVVTVQPSAAITVVSGTPIVNSGVFEVQDDIPFKLSGNSKPVFNNSGTFRKDVSSKTLSMSFLLLLNTGTVDVQAGGIDFTLNTHTFASGSRLTGPGPVRIAGATAAMNGSLRVESPFELASGSLTGDATIGGSFRMSGGQLPGVVVVTNAFTWSGGTVSGTLTANSSIAWSGGTLSGVLNVPATCRFDLQVGATKLMTGTLNSFGTLSLLEFSQIQMDSGCVINNAGLCESYAGNPFAHVNGGTPTFNNTGTFRKLSAGDSTIGLAVIFNNSGILDVASNALSFTSGTHTFNSGSRLTGAGLTRVAGATVNWNGAITNTAQVELASGLLNAAGTLNGALRWSGGTLGGLLTITPGSEVRLVGAATKTLDSITVTNLGSMILEGSGALAFSDDAIIENNGLFEMQAANSFTIPSSGKKWFNNRLNGIVRKTGSTQPFNFGSVILQNSGVLDIQAGTISFTANTHTLDTGTRVTGPGAAVLNGATLNLNSVIPFESPLQLVSGSLSANGTVNGRVQWSGGQVLGTLVVSNGLAWSGGQLLGTLTANGDSTWSGGTLTGTLNVPADQHLSLLQGNTKLITGILNNAGRSSLADTEMVQMDNGAQINNSGLFEAYSSIPWKTLNGNRPVFNNTGTFRKLDTRTLLIPIAVEFRNSGILEAAAGIVSFTTGVHTFNDGSRIVGSGLVQVAGATINFAGNIKVNGPFALNSGLVNGTGCFDGDWTWSGGAVTGTLTHKAGNTLLITGSSTCTFNQDASLLNAGTVILDSSKALTFYDRTTINNSGLFEWRSGVGFALVGSAKPVFVNSGTFRKTQSTAILAFDVIQVQNSGVLDVQAGVLSFPANTHSFSTGSRVTGAAITRFSGATVTLAGSVDFAGPVELTAGTLQGTASINGNLAWSGGGIGGSGPNAGATLNLNGNLSWSGGLLYGALTENGTADWSDGTVYGTLRVAPSARLNILNGGNPTLSGAVTNLGQATTVGNASLTVLDKSLFINSGLLEAQFEKPFIFSGNGSSMLINSGTLRKTVSTKALDFASVLLQNSGTLDLQAGDVTFSANSHSFANRTRTAGPGTVRVTGGTLTLDGTNTMDAPFELASGILLGTATINANSGMTWSGGTIPGGSSPGAFTVNGVLNWSGGTLDGTLTGNGTMNWSGGLISGTLSIPAASRVNVLPPGNGSISGLLQNSGTVVVSNNASIRLLAGTPVVNSGVFEVQNEQALKPNGTTKVNFINSGTLRKTISTKLMKLDYVQLQNNGTLDLQAGELSLQLNSHSFADGTRTTGTGAVHVAGATLNVAGNFTLGPALAMDSGYLAGSATLNGPFQFNGGEVQDKLKIHGQFAWAGGLLKGGVCVQGGATWTGGELDGSLTVATNGTLAISGAATKSIKGGILTNSGFVTVTSPVTLQCDGGAVIQNFGGFNLPVSMSVTTPWGGKPAFNNYGALSLTNGFSLFEFPGKFFQFPSGLLELEIGGRNAGTNFSQLCGAPDLTLDGALVVRTVGGFQPALGDRLEIVKCSDRIGTFATYSANTPRYSPDYSDTNVTLFAAAPTFTSQPVSQTVGSGVNVIFSAGAYGSQPMSWRWLRNDAPLPGATNALLAFTNVQPANEGAHVAVVSNIWGSITSTQAVLKVIVPPAITRQPVAETVNQGETALFSVQASGNYLSYRWRSESDWLPGATNATLVLSNASPANAGRYKVEVSNPGGIVVSTEVILAVIVPPTITEQPVSQNVGAGSGLTLNVKVSGTAPFSYLWLKNGAPVPGATNASLTLNNVGASQAGSYVVLVANGAGTATSQPAIIAIRTPPMILTQPLSQIVNVGSNVLLAVTATAVPAPTYQWRKNGVTLYGATSPTLVLTNVQPGHSGDYSVVVANSQGFLESAAAHITVVVPELLFTDAFSPRGLVYSASGFGHGTNVGATKETGEPTHAGKGGATKTVWISWWAPANGIATFSTAGSDFDTVLAVYRGAAVNALTKVAADDDSAGFHCSKVSFNAVAGTYYQIAVAGEGAEAGNIILSWDLLITTELLPEITQAPSDVTGNINDVVALQVVFSAFEPTAIQWFYQGQTLAGATNATYVIPSLQDDKVGGYAVRLTGASGRNVVSPPGDIQINTEGASGVSARNKFFDAAERALTP